MLCLPSSRGEQRQRIYLYILSQASENSIGDIPAVFQTLELRTSSNFHHEILLDTASSPSVIRKISSSCSPSNFLALRLCCVFCLVTQAPPSSYEKSLSSAIVVIATVPSDKNSLTLGISFPYWFILENHQFPSL